MGLDIYHIKLLKERPSNIGYSNEGIYLENGFGEFNKSDWKIIEPFVQEVKYFNLIKTAFFSTKFSEIDFLRKETKGIDILTAENESNLAEQIRAFEKRLNLQNSYKEVQNSNPPWNQIKYYEKEIKVGFYTAEVGYQRKGITDKFWEFFDFEEIHHYYFEQKYFLNAHSCIGHYWDSDSNEDVQQRKMKFKADFIDNYEFGKSFMYLSF